MADILFTDQMDVDLIRQEGGDESVVRSARISTSNEVHVWDPEKDPGLINYLMKKRHGSPFEHNLFTFRISAPIFVFREWHRHRIGWSYNEQSGRYTVFEPKFYIYPEARPMVQIGSSAHPKLAPGTPDQFQIVNGAMRSGYERAWLSYQAALNAGAANEVARAVLPVGTFSTMYATANARSIMSFLSLRIDHEENYFETKPQWEIEQLARQIESIFAEKMPVTHAAWNKFGRISP